MAWEGLISSLAKFGLQGWFVCFANVLSSEGMGGVVGTALSFVFNHSLSLANVLSVLAHLIIVLEYVLFMLALVLSALGRVLLILEDVLFYLVLILGVLEPIMFYLVVIMGGLGAIIK
jgi:hypothetical protein